MSTVPGFEHDVFLSYAWVDNPQRLPWVTHFAEFLRDMLVTSDGLKGRFDRVYQDVVNRNEDEPLSSHLRSKVQKSACMVSILSPGYIESSWCRQELDAFLEAVNSRDLAGRLFLIDTQKLSIEARLAAVQTKKWSSIIEQVTGRAFYYQPDQTMPDHHLEPLGFPEPHPTSQEKNHREYFSKVLHLARDIALSLKRFRSSVASARLEPRESPVKIYVAETSEEVSEERSEILQYLAERPHLNLQVVPTLDDALPNNWIEWQKATDAALRDAALFVQILGTHSGRKISGSNKWWVTEQRARAEAASIPVLAWRKFKPAKVTDAETRKLVEVAEYGGLLEEFKKAVLEKARQLAQPAVPTSVPLIGKTAAPWVFVQADKRDEAEAESLLNTLSDLNCNAVASPFRGRASEIRKFEEDQLNSCDGLIFYYGKGGATPLKTRVINSWKKVEERRNPDAPRPLRALAIGNCGPQDRHKLGLSVHGLEYIAMGPEGGHEGLTRWVSKLRTAGAT